MKQMKGWGHGSSDSAHAWHQPLLRLYLSTDRHSPVAPKYQGVTLAAQSITKGTTAPAQAPNGRSAPELAWRPSELAVALCGKFFTKKKKCYLCKQNRSAAVYNRNKETMDLDIITCFIFKMGKQNYRELIGNYFPFLKSIYDQF